MALIEHLSKPNWKTFLGDTFNYVLEVLQEEPRRSVGSSADDLRSWLSIGGVPNVYRRLSDQMRRSCFDAEHIAEVFNFLEELIENNQTQLKELIAKERIANYPLKIPKVLDFNRLDIVDLIYRIQAGERPFEDWMYENGYTRKDIQEVYQVIDQWLIAHGLLAPPWTKDRLN
ncbi:MAG: hypothetical protein AAF806_23505 [Bacteroidota bacterium]